MKKLNHVTFVIAALMLAGCVPSLNPLYTEKDVIYDSDLVGVWQSADEKEKGLWTFEKGEGLDYKLVLTEDDKSSPFVAHLLQLGKHRFLDLCPDKSSVKAGKTGFLYDVALIPGHLFFKVAQIKPTLQVAILDVDWLDKLLKANPKALAHQEMEGGGMVLTATTKALQEFVTKNWDTEGAWGEKGLSTLRRK